MFGKIISQTKEWQDFEREMKLLFPEITRIFYEDAIVGSLDKVCIRYNEGEKEMIWWCPITRAKEDIVNKRVFWDIMTNFHHYIGREKYKRYYEL